MIAPVRVGDTIHAIVEVAGVKPTSKGNRAIVDSTIEVFNQNDEPVLTYTAKRMLAGREPEGDTMTTDGTTAPTSATPNGRSAPTSPPATASSRATA